MFIKTCTHFGLSSQTLNLQAHVWSVQKLLHQMFFTYTDFMPTKSFMVKSKYLVLCSLWHDDLLECLQRSTSIVKH